MRGKLESYHSDVCRLNTEITSKDFQRSKGTETLRNLTMKQSEWLKIKSSSMEPAKITLKELKAQRSLKNLNKIYSDHESVRGTCKQLDLELREAEYDYNRQRQLARTLNEDISRLESEIASGEYEKMQLLRRRSSDTYMALKWIEQNQKVFKNPDKVHGPIMLCLNLKDRAFAVHMEKQIGWSDLLAFVCESAEDANILMNARTEHHFPRVNVVQSSAVYGISNHSTNSCVYLSDLINDDCPEAVLGHLIRAKRLNEIPVFRDPNSKEIETFSSRGKSHFVNDYFYSYFKSRYSGNFTEASESLAGIESKFLDVKSRPQSNENEKLLKSLKAKCQKANASIAHFETKKRENDAKQLLLRQLEDELNTVKKLDNRIQFYEQELAGESDSKLEQDLALFPKKCNEILELIRSVNNLQLEVCKLKRELRDLEVSF